MPLGKKSLIGSYNGHYGEHLEIRPDSTFYYTWHFDMQFQWTKGTWTINKDTLELQVQKVWDTVLVSGSDKLELSFDSVASRENYSTYYDTLRSGNQTLERYPKRLLLKKNSLYRITHAGEIDKRRVRGIWTKKKIPTWFRKQK